MHRQIRTSKNAVLDIQSDDPKVEAHFAGAQNYADVIIMQINQERVFDKITKGRSDLVLVDIGANIGLFSLFAQDSAEKIYAIEPTPEHFYILEQLTSKFDNIKRINAAFHSENTSVDFYISDDNSTMNSTVNQQGKKIIVPARTIGSILKENNVTHVDAVKCDIEGSEMAAFNDAVLEETKDIIDMWSVEVHATTHDGMGINQNRDKLADLFRRHGYIVTYDRFDSLMAQTTRW